MEKATKGTRGAEVELEESKVEGRKLEKAKYCSVETRCLIVNVILPADAGGLTTADP